MKIPPQYESSVTMRAEKIKMLITDVDGVLTNGMIYYDAQGIETKAFNVKDGMGFNLLRHAGIGTGIITGRESSIVAKRAEELHVEECFQGVKKKGEVLDAICDRNQLEYHQIAYIGDDVNDLPILTKVGLSVCPVDAHQLVKNHSFFISANQGGKGVFREVADLILNAQGFLDELLKKFN